MTHMHMPCRDRDVTAPHVQRARDQQQQQLNYRPPHFMYRFIDFGLLPVLAALPDNIELSGPAFDERKVYILGMWLVQVQYGKRIEGLEIYLGKRKMAQKQGTGQSRKWAARLQRKLVELGFVPWTAARGKKILQWCEFSPTVLFITLLPPFGGSIFKYFPAVLENSTNHPHKKGPNYKRLIFG